MFKKIAVALVAILFIVSASAAYAAGDTCTVIGEKCKRGLVNTFTGWMELPFQVKKGFNEGFKGDENHKVMGVVTGLVRGVFNSIGRTISGVVDVVGCWAVAPADNEGAGLALGAKNAWDDSAVYDIADPSLEVATFEPMGKKFMRGLGNGLFGIAEFPGQIVKGVKEGTPIAGIGKGIWYFVSREISGLYDLATMPFPTPEESLGIHFEQEWPWTDLCDNIKK